MLPSETTFINTEAGLARQFIAETNVSVFLTGSAGTGKTTFLRNLLEDMPKQTLVAAPTGVAAINAGGMTLHSLFGLPLRMYFPTRDRIDPNLGNNTDMLASHFRYNKDKRLLLQTLELLVIDEISMVRADIFDAVDLALRYVRRDPAPFGGVQLLLIGDLAQLPPVLREEERAGFEKYYKGPFFFQSQAWKALQAVQIKLRHIYRQSDPRFINLLNNLRENRITTEDRLLLNSRLISPEKTGNRQPITLTSHNRKADNMNQDALSRLPGQARCFSAEIKGEINEAQVSAEKELLLKPGAQVMFIRNDSSGERRYFNGKIGTLTGLDDDTLQVHFPDTETSISVERDTWENVRYRFDPEKQAVQSETVGTYKQFPVRLAWAVTIHKSQGLTFDHAVIDAGESFAAGQVYVALSRCRSLEGLYLNSSISDRNLFTDPHVAAFLDQPQDPEALEQRLAAGREAMLRTALQRVFRLSDLSTALNGWYQEVGKSTKIARHLTEELYAETVAGLSKWTEIEPKLQKQWNELFSAQPPDEQVISEKLYAALHWYSAQLKDLVIPRWDAYLVQLLGASGTVTAFRQSLEFRDMLANRLARMHRFQYRGVRMLAALEDISFKPDEDAIDIDIAELDSWLSGRSNNNRRVTKRKGPAPVKGDSLAQTRAMFREGKNPEEIAGLRNLKPSTIEGHFKELIKSGDVKVEELLPMSRVLSIKSLLEKNEGITLKELLENDGKDLRPAEVYWVKASMAK
jgi:hypothetical protein